MFLVIFWRHALLYELVVVLILESEFRANVPRHQPEMRFLEEISFGWLVGVK